MPITSTKHSIATPVSLSQRVVIAVGASLLGLCLVYFAGFAHRGGAQCRPRYPPQRRLPLPLSTPA